MGVPPPPGLKGLFYCFVLQRKGSLLKALVTKLKRSSYILVTIITVKSQSARDTQSQFAREGVGLCPFRGLCEEIRVITLTAIQY